MVFARLLVGEGEKLEGRVIVYAKVTNCSDIEFVINWEKMGGLQQILPGGTSIVAQYITIHAIDFAAEGKSDPAEIKKSLVEIEENVRQNFVDECGEDNLPFFYTFKRAVLAPSETAILQRRNDVVFVGSYENPALSWEALKSGERFYMVGLQQQIEHDLKALGWRDVEEKKYSVFGERSILDCLRNVHVKLLVHGRVENNATLWRIGENKLREFSRGSAFEQDVDDLCSFIDGPWLPVLHEHVIGLWAEKINAIHQQNYELAGKLRDDIERLKKSVS